jgi:hypothetical protein
MAEDNLPSLFAPQRARLWLIGAMLVIAVGTHIYTEKLARAFGISNATVQLGVFVLVLSSLVTASFAGRCSNCGLRLVPYAMSHKSRGEWLRWLLALKTCPKCGHPGLEDQRVDP